MNEPGGTVRTAFVLAGGAALGAMHAGMLHALYERGITADLLIGTSAGAMNAAFVASRPQTVATARELGAVWCGLRRRNVFPLSPAALLAGLTGLRDHLVPDRGLRRVAARHLQISRLEEAAVPLHLIAYDPLSGQEVRLSKGPAAEAVLASAAIPGLLPPVRFGDRLLTDGGVCNNTPISHAVQLGAERIYVLPTADPGDRALPRAPGGAPAAAVNALTQLFGARLEADLARYATAAEMIILPAANPQHVPLTSFAHAGELIGQTYAAARTALAAHDVRPGLALAS
jgi:NTE family protein